MTGVHVSAFAAPVECSCRPTSKDSLSVRDLDVFKQVRYWGRGGRNLDSFENIPFLMFIKCKVMERSFYTAKHL